MDKKKSMNVTNVRILLVLHELMINLFTKCHESLISMHPFSSILNLLLSHTVMALQHYERVSYLMWDKYKKGRGGSMFVWIMCNMQENFLEVK